MPVYFDQEAGVGRAVWRSEDGAEEVPLCSVSLAAYDSEAVVREHFTALVNAVADHHRRTHVAVAAVSWRRDSRAFRAVTARRLRPTTFVTGPGKSPT